MHILITGGGTEIAIDPIRSIRNKSSGQLGAALAKEALIAGCQVSYLCATGAYSPFAYHHNFYGQQDFEKADHAFHALKQWVTQYQNQYQEIRFQSYEDYACILKQCILQEKPDIIILAAAVSDYLVANPSLSKIRSSEELNIHLKPAAKIIHDIKKWLPQTFLIGFKLEVGLSEQDLVLRALKSLNQHQLDLVVANDLVSLEQGTHTLLVIEQNGDYQKYTHDRAQKLIARALKRWKP